MCKGAPHCSELGSDPAKWSRDAPLPPPTWFQGELDLFARSVRLAADGDVLHARSLLAEVRSDDLRAWYLVHGQNSGGFRARHFRLPSPATISGRQGPAIQVDDQLYAGAGSLSMPLLWLATVSNRRAASLRRDGRCRLLFLHSEESQSWRSIGVSRDL